MRKCFKNAYERIQLHQQITNALHQYRQALIEAHQIGMLSKPSATALKTSQLYFDTEEDGKILVGYDATMLQDPEDLVALIPSPDDDRLSRLLRSVCGRCLQDRKRTAPQLHSDIYYFPAHRVQILSYSVSAIFCAVLLVGAMACLGAINQASWQLRIGMVALFTFLFATFVALLTNAKRSEVFAATAAYAAVLVVYVSAGVGSSGKQVDVALTGG
ncbi:hypothetical protein K469DRAFT_708806 [Zopfia rhizophila CBS 207.26]|uniref:DUF6594 domain-containing protein n=1 Tax=Zopfia rhizophila CBS 207.26 TaxID=1314779 RepID=A0A6A6DY58_9PEZI|nr:hypothetical protein K469DRAFT_708806 [Zopfia rhizophila CBS 207.26]